ncbi:hypothetical protein AgCh_012476 [Apium graveolens]
MAEVLKISETMLKVKFELREVLVPCQIAEETEVNGYIIQKNSQVLVNSWAIGRDPVSWENPLSFQPERSLHTAQEATTSQINQIKESLIASRLTTHQEIQKKMASIIVRQSTIEVNQARLEAK